MGIPYYFSYLIQNYNEIIKNLNTINNINNLYIDSNSIIYDSVKNIEHLYENNEQFENLLITNVIEKLEEIINYIKPTNRIIIAFDGIPPFAKIKQQKNRRYKSYIQNNLLNKKNVWDTISITPGTKFMNKLDYKLSKHFTQKNIILSLSNVAGEGEHKIFKYIRNNKHDDENILIYGMDADLFMLSLLHLKYSKNIYLYRETPSFINSLNCSLNKDEKYYININILGLRIFNIMTSEIEFNYELFYKIIEDYILLCFFLGNDFMPHFPILNIRLNGLDLLLNLYKQLFNNKKHFIDDNNKILWSNLKLYLTKLAENEKNLFIELHNYREKFSKKYLPNNTEEEKEKKFMLTPSLNLNIENYINPSEDFWEYRYYYSLFDVDIDLCNNIINKIAYNYLETLQWTYYYYSDDCYNWKHYYKYDYAPLLTDLYKHVPYFNSELILKQEKDVLTSNILLAIVLPYNSLNLLPNNIHNYLLKNYENHYRTDYNIKLSYCKYFWETHVNFPVIDYEKFINDLKNIST